MKKQIIIILAVLVVLLAGTGFVVYRVLTAPAPVTQTSDEEMAQDLPEVDSSVKVDLKKNPAAANTVMLSIAGMAGKMSEIRYELTYDSQGLIKGVNSGSKPIDVAGKDTFQRDDIYLGTCSKNDCKPDTGVSAVTVTLEFTGTDGKKYSFSKDYQI